MKKNVPFIPVGEAFFPPVVPFFRTALPPAR